MKWIEISKAKVKFNTSYLLNVKEGVQTVGVLHESRKVQDGVTHTFNAQINAGTDPVSATHVALITQP